MSQTLSGKKQQARSQLGRLSQLADVPPLEEEEKIEEKNEVVLTLKEAF